MSANNLTMFKGHLDRYNGVTVSSEEENCGSIQEFNEKLEGIVRHDLYKVLKLQNFILKSFL